MTNFQTAAASWFDGLKQAWLAKDLDAVTALLADKFEYYESHYLYA